MNYILIQTENGTDVSELAHEVVKIPGVVSAKRVTGAYDVIAEAGDSHATGAIQELEGVLRAITLPIAS